MATFVIVHGGWAGGWAFSEVASRLRKQGHEVFTPTLTGVGERVHLARPEIDLYTHIEDVVNVLVYENLEDVVLVAYSSGGMVVAGVADRIPERIRHLIYVDALLPENGESLLDLLGSEVAEALVAQIDSEGEGWYLPQVTPPPEGQPLPSDYAGLSGEQVKSIFDRVTLHPAEPAKSTIILENPISRDLPGIYILCTDKLADWFVWPAMNKSVERARKRGWLYRELATGHCPQWTMSKELTDLLLEAA